MAPWTGILALTMVVRDEDDVLEANIDYHLSQGVDVILVVDHGSSDDTPAILARYEQLGRLRWFRDEARPHVQADRVNRLLGMAADEHQADWVIHCDADEFWVPAAGSLRDVFAAVPDRYGYLRVRRHNFVPAPDRREPFHQGMTVRHRCSLNLRGTPLEPKVAQRPGAGTVTSGNHDLDSPKMELAPDFGAVEVLHFQMRSYGQFEKKVLRNGVGHECNPEREDGIGCDQLELLAIYRRGALRAYYELEALDAARIERGLELGELVLDQRLQRRLENRPARAEDSNEMQELLRQCWEWGGMMIDARRDADERAMSLLDDVAHREAMVARLESQLSGLERTLEVVRNSRVMRYTAPARRAYYKARGIT